MNENQKRKREKILSKVDEVLDKGFTGRIVLYIDAKMGAIARIFREVKEEI